MNSKMLHNFNIINIKVLFGVILSLISFLSFAYTQENLNQMLNEEVMQNRAALQLITNPQTRNDNELSMFIMHIIESKNIKDFNKKIEFIDTFKVSDDIKQQAKVYVKQNLNYSDFRKVDYGVYILKNCHQTSSKNLSNCYEGMMQIAYKTCAINPFTTCCIN